jgi:hypothetical protein
MDGFSCISCYELAALLWVLGFNWPDFGLSWARSLARPRTAYLDGRDWIDLSDFEWRT